MKARLASVPQGLRFWLGFTVAASLIYALAWIGATAWHVSTNWGDIGTAEMNAAVHSSDCRPTSIWTFSPFTRDWDYVCGPDAAGDYTGYRVDHHGIVAQSAPGKKP